MLHGILPFRQPSTQFLLLNMSTTSVGEKSPQIDIAFDKIMIDLSNEQKDMLLTSQLSEQLQRIVTTVVRIERPDMLFDELYVGINFISEEEMCKMHQVYFDDPSPTDCISFPCDIQIEEGIPFVLGDLFVCPKVAKEYAEEQKGEPYEELTLYVVHCLLHLLGHEDTEPEMEVKMRQAEKICMQQLKVNNLLLTKG
jgi:probable rRNA maturation factor